MTTWTEPASRLRRWWGNYRARYLIGLLVIATGVAATNPSNTYSLWFLLIGPIVQAVGWVVIPGALWRRLVVLIPCLLAGLVLVAGADFAGAFAVLLAGWLLVRHRPLLSYSTLVLPIAASFVLKAELHDYDQKWIALLAGSAVIVVAAWLARWLATTRRIPSESRSTFG